MLTRQLIESQNKLSFGYVIVLIGTMLWCVLLFVPPFIAAWEQPPSTASHYSYMFFSTICHQYDSRSLHIAGHKLAVCARCSGIYFGFFFSALLAPIFLGRKSRQTLTLLVLAALPMILDVAVGVIGLHEPTIITRLSTGLFFGVIAGIALVPIWWCGSEE